jgi:hypothetical protein
MYKLSCLGWELRKRFRTRKQTHRYLRMFHPLTYLRAHRASVIRIERIK